MTYAHPQRNSLLTEFGKSVLRDRYLQPNEDYQDMFIRVSKAYADDESHAKRLYEYMSSLWFMPATPILANGGTNRGLPISCFLNEAQDDLRSIANLWNENIFLASNGGGIGSYISNIRSIGEEIAGRGVTSGVIPFLKVVDSMTLAISQGSLRRGSASVYMSVDHPEFPEFIDIRRPTGGDTNRRCLNIHHGVVLTDEFMEAVKQDKEWRFKSPKTGEFLGGVMKARELWIKALNARLETGEPYILYIDTVNKTIPEHHKKLGMKVKTSNLCSEITLPTGIDYKGNERTAVCCLSSLNLERYDDWKGNEIFIEDVMRFLDNVLTDFIEKAPDEMHRAKYSASMERSVGLGVMGYHTFLQEKMLPFDSLTAKNLNKEIFSHIKKQCDEASKKLAKEKGACPDAKEVGIEERFSNKIAIAPTASISIICGGTSPTIEPITANVYNHKTLSGSFIVQNKTLKKVLASKNQDTAEVWNRISTNNGSVQDLPFLTQDEKDVFRTAFEIPQMSIVEQAGDRQPFVCQAQSVNLYLPSDISKKDLNIIHFSAWTLGVKSLYYCRSRSLGRLNVVGLGVAGEVEEKVEKNTKDGEECEVCQ